MAEELRGHHWDAVGKKYLHQSIRYPWAKWFNGSMWLLIQGEDFTGDTAKFQRYLLRYAKDWNVKVKTKKAANGKDLYIKAIGGRPLKPESGKKKNMHFDALDRRYEQLQERAHERDEEGEGPQGP